MLIACCFIPLGCCKAPLNDECVFIDGVCGARARVCTCVRRSH